MNEQKALEISTKATWYQVQLDAGNLAGQAAVEARIYIALAQDYGIIPRQK